MIVNLLSGREYSALGLFVSELERERPDHSPFAILSLRFTKPFVLDSGLVRRRRWGLVPSLDGSRLYSRDLETIGVVKQLSFGRYFR